MREIYECIGDIPNLSIISYQHQTIIVVVANIFLMATMIIVPNILKSTYMLSIKDNEVNPDNDTQYLILENSKEILCLRF